MRSSLLLCVALLAGCATSESRQAPDEPPLWYSDLASYKRQYPGRYVIGVGVAMAETEAWSAARQDARSKVDPGERLDDESFFFLDSSDGQRIPTFDAKSSLYAKVIALLRVLPAAAAPVAPAAPATVDVASYVLLMATEGEEPAGNALLVEGPDGVQHNLWVGARLDGRTIREIQLTGEGEARAVALTLEDAAGTRDTVLLRRRGP